MKPAGLVILGSTGSIGRSTLAVVTQHPGRFRVIGLSAHRNVERLASQCVTTGAQYAAIGSGREDALRTRLAESGSTTQVVGGDTALEELVALDGVSAVMAGIVGAAGLRPTLRATELGHKVLLANKEPMVIAGPLFAAAQAASGAQIIPVDSEHNALFQALPPDFRQGLEQAGVTRLILTASGGPFLHASQDELQSVTPEQACNHPNWDMGQKISVDSATLMNKGLEVIEARWLFNARPEQIEVKIHPQSIVHSMVAYRDGSVLAQMGRPDMRTPIAHALGWPDRIDAGVDALDLAATGPLEFTDPDLDRFPCLRLAFEALSQPGSGAVALNAANEVAVQSFLNREIPFMHIAELAEKVLNALAPSQPDCLDAVMAIDAEARALAGQYIGQRELSHV